jgi:uncharacterized protein YjbJ (UPF0337 family)
MAGKVPAAPGHYNVAGCRPFERYRVRQRARKLQETRGAHERTITSAKNRIAATGRLCHMKPSSEDKLKGKVQEIKGALKEQAGKLSGDPDLEDEGTVEKVVGKGRQVIGAIEKAAGA